MPFMPKGMSLPDINDQFTKEYWEHAKKHELVIQKCNNCGTFRFTPAPICYHCQSFDFEWHKVSGKGTVYSYTIVHYPAHPALKEKVPYNIVLVEIPDAGNVRILGNLIDGTPDEEILIGMPVEVTFEKINDDVTLPQWKRAT